MAKIYSIIPIGQCLHAQTKELITTVVVKYSMPKDASSIWYFSKQLPPQSKYLFIPWSQFCPGVPILEQQIKKSHNIDFLMLYISGQSLGLSSLLSGFILMGDDYERNQST